MATVVGCRTGEGRAEVDVIVERCAGLDVHKKTVMACVRKPADGERVSVSIFRNKSQKIFKKSRKGNPPPVVSVSRRNVRGRVAPISEESRDEDG